MATSIVCTCTQGAQHAILADSEAINSVLSQKLVDIYPTAMLY